MQINYKFTNMEPDEKLRAYAEIKVHAFEKFIHGDHLEGAVCDVEFSLPTKQKTGDVCRAEVNLAVDGKLFRSKKKEPTLRKAIDKVKDDILAELRKAKTKKKDVPRRLAARAKLQTEEV